jgi:hypothetical protein
VRCDDGTGANHDTRGQDCIVRDDGRMVDAGGGERFAQQPGGARKPETRLFDLHDGFGARVGWSSARLEDDNPSMT